jgi:hypothetical protein
MTMMCISYFFSELIRDPQMSFTWMLNHFVEGMPSENQILVHLCSPSSKFEIYKRQCFLHVMTEASDEGGSVYWWPWWSLSSLLTLHCATNRGLIHKVHLCICISMAAILSPVI